VGQFLEFLISSGVNVVLVLELCAGGTSIRL